MKWIFDTEAQASFYLFWPWRNVTHIHHVYKYITQFSLTLYALYVSGIREIKNHDVE